MIERRPLKQTNGSTAAAEATVTADSPLPDRLRELERRIGAALGSFVPQVQNSPDAESASGEPTAAALGDLLAQLDRAVIAAAEHARAEHEKSLDPLAFPDAREARQSAEDAAFMANRLRTLQPRLLDAYTRTVERERVAAYLAKRAELAPERDRLEQEFTAGFPELCGKLLELFGRLRDFQNRARIALANPPSGVSVLEPIQGAAVLDKVTLFDFENKQTWPPPQANFASDFVQSMPLPLAVGASWTDPATRERRRRELEAEAQRIGAFHEQQTREQESRINAEERERFQQQQGGQ
jgi:hypothetical protein